MSIVSRTAAINLLVALVLTMVVAFLLHASMASAGEEAGVETSHVEELDVWTNETSGERAEARP